MACATSAAPGTRNDPKTEPAKDAGSKPYVDMARPEDARWRRFAESSVRYVGQQAELPGALYRLRQLALVAAAAARDASRADLALLAHGAAQRAEVLVVDDVDLVTAERTRLEPPATGRTLAAVTSATAGL